MAHWQISSYLLFSLCTEKKDVGSEKFAQAIVKEVLNPCSDPPLLRLPLGKELHEGMKKVATDSRTM
jgi:hypothetical protein